ncbi:PaaI family thioesterase [soil metagenome]
MTPSFPREPEALAEWFEEHGRSRLPGLLGIDIVTLEPEHCVLRCDIDQRHLASNGYLHAATVIALADTASGYGCVASLPETATSFTTIEVKSNHTGTVLEGGVHADATLFHGGRTLQVWDATVVAEETGRTLAGFRCTQLILY